jgi:ATP-dependent DNA helicase RecQ
MGLDIWWNQSFDIRMNPREAQQEVRQLVALCNAANEQVRANCRSRLSRLRSLYATLPAEQKTQYFPGPSIRALKDAARLLDEAPDETLREMLRKTFGHNDFRPGQEQIIRSVLGGLDCLAVMPTGGGKSLTYQFPARHIGGTTLVISPLIALMKDQVDALTRKGLRATYLNSSLEEAERRRRITGICAGNYELVYAAPEGIEFYVGSLLEQVDLRLVAVDEAHCISEWGHDFRPSYRNFAGLKQRFGNVPLLALAATATMRVQQDIVEQLGMDAPARFQGSFFRPNLKISAVTKVEGATLAKKILKLVKARKGQPGIIYCCMRKTVEAVAEALQEKGIKAVAEALQEKGIKAMAYHAGLETKERIHVHERFRDNQVDVMVATIAFGMGIDKSNIRYVIHRDMPRSIESYAQEIGRAGRDGADSECILFYAWPDVLLYERMTNEQHDLTATLREERRRQARDMFAFAEAKRCRHQALAAHFGEQMEACGASCDMCTGVDILA